MEKCHCGHCENCLNEGRPDIGRMDAEKIRRGKMLAEVLCIEPTFSAGPLTEPRYNTAWGDKTALGLYETAARIIKEGR